MNKRKVKITKTGYLPDSPDRFNDMNIIPSNRITMKNVKFPILGIDDLGNQQMMMPGGEYEFPGKYVTEVPLGKYQKGGRAPRVISDPEEFKIANQAYADSLSLYNKGIEDKKAYQNLTEDLGFVPEAIHERNVTPAEDYYDPKYRPIRFGSVTYTGSDGNLDYYNNGDNRQIILKGNGYFEGPVRGGYNLYKKPTQPVVFEPPLERVEPRPITKLPVSEPKLQPVNLSVSKSRTLDSYDPNYTQKSGQLKKGTYYYDKDLKRWQYKLAEQEEMDYEREKGTIKKQQGGGIYMGDYEFKDGGLVKYQKKGQVSFDEYMMEGLRPQTAVQDNTYVTNPRVEEAKRDERDGMTPAKKVKAAATKKKIAEEEKKEQIKQELLDQGEIKPATDGTERLKNQFIYAMDQPLDAVGSLMQRGYVPQGNLSGNYPTSSPMSDVIGAFNPASVLMDVGRVGRDLGEKETYTTWGGAGELGLNAAGFLPFGDIARKSAKAIPTGSAKNLADLKKLKVFAKQYGYELPDNLERIAQSDELTNRTVRGLMNRHNTFVRGVSTNWDVIGQKNPEVLRILKDNNIDYINNPEDAVRFMSEYIPPSTGYGRYGLKPGEDAIYLSNSNPTADAYTYGDGYVATVRRPTDFSSLDREDWIKGNDFTAAKDFKNSEYGKGIVKNDYVRPFSLNPRHMLAGTGDPDLYSEYQKKIIDGLQKGQDYTYELNKKLKFQKSNYSRKVNAKKPNVFYDEDFEPLRDKPNLLDKLYLGSFDARMFGNKAYHEVLKPIVKGFGSLYTDPRILKPYFKNAFGTPDPFSHYAIKGKPGDKVLDVINMRRVTPDMQINDSRSHVNTYSRKLSRKEEGGVYLGQYEFRDGGLVKIENDLDTYGYGGKVVSEIWTEKTGLPWSAAKKLGLSDGSYDRNIQLREELIRGEHTNLNKNPQVVSKPKVKQTTQSVRQNVPVTTPPPQVSRKPQPVSKPLSTQYGVYNWNKNTPQVTKENTEQKTFDKSFNLTTRGTLPELKQDESSKFPTFAEFQKQKLNSVLTATQPVSKSGSLPTENKRSGVTQKDQAYYDLLNSTKVEYNAEVESTARTLSRPQSLDTLERNKNIQNLILNTEVAESQKSTLRPSTSTASDSSGSFEFPSATDVLKKFLPTSAQAFATDEGREYLSQKLKDYVQMGQTFLEKQGLKDPSVEGNLVTFEQPKPVLPVKQEPTDIKQPKNYFIPPTQTAQDNNADYGDPQNEFWGYRYQNSNDSGLVYVPAPRRGVINEKGIKKFNNVKGVAHFLIQKDPVDNWISTGKGSSKEKLESDLKHGKNYIPFSKKEEDGKVRLKYAKGKEEQKQLEKEGYEPFTTLRNLKLSNIDWNKTRHPISGGYGKGISNVVTKDGKDTHLLFKDASGKGNKLGKYNGTSVVFIIETPEGRVIRDFAGTVQAIEDESKSILKEFKVPADKVTLGFYDSGSHAARPKANKNNEVYYKQYSGFSNESAAAGALMIPADNNFKEGGQSNNQGIYLGNYEFKNGGLVKYQSQGQVNDPELQRRNYKKGGSPKDKGWREYKTPTGQSLYLDPRFKNQRYYVDEKGNAVTPDQNMSLFDVQDNIWESGTSMKPLEISPRYAYKQVPGALGAIETIRYDLDNGTNQITTPDVMTTNREQQSFVNSFNPAGMFTEGLISMGQGNIGEGLTELAFSSPLIGRAIKSLKPSPTKVVTKEIAETPLSTRINLGGARSKSKSKIFKSSEIVEDPDFNIEKVYRGSVENPKLIKIKGKSGEWTLNRSSDDSYYFNAGMSNPFESGKAMLKINELLPPKPVILEPNSLSLDSYKNVLKLGKKPHWKMEFKNYIPLNHSAIHNKALSSKFGFNPEGTYVPFTSLGDANAALKEVNAMLKKHGINYEADVFGNGNGAYGIKIPNFKLSRDYKQGGDIYLGQYEFKDGGLDKAQKGLNKRMVRQYPGMKSVYGDRGENLNVIKDKNFIPSEYGYGDIEFIYPGSGLVTYNDEYAYQSPTPDKYTAVYNPKGANKHDVFLDMMHGMRHDPDYMELLNEFSQATRNARGADMDYFFDQDAQQDPNFVIDGREQWDNNYIDGMVRAHMYKKASQQKRLPFVNPFGSKPHGTEDYEMELEPNSPEMYQAADQIYNYIKGDKNRSLKKVKIKSLPRNTR